MVLEGEQGQIVEGAVVLHLEQEAEEGIEGENTL